MQKMNGSFYQGVLLDGNAVVISMTNAPIPATIWAKPASGDTVAVSYSVDGGVSYIAWDNGDVTAFASDVLSSGVTHMKFQRTAGSGVTSTVGVC